LIWIILTFVTNSSGIIGAFHQNPYINTSSLATEKKITNTIISDADSANYNVFAYSPSIYSYEYSYLFKWLDNRDFPYDPGANKIKSNLVYIIVPPSSKKTMQNFINYRTPDLKYLTVNQWRFQDGSIVIKRKQKVTK
jgi:hypothetical protein